MAAVPTYDVTMNGNLLQVLVNGANPITFDLVEQLGRINQQQYNHADVLTFFKDIFGADARKDNCTSQILAGIGNDYTNMTPDDVKTLAKQIITTNLESGFIQRIDILRFKKYKQGNTDVLNKLGVLFSQFNAIHNSEDSGLKLTPFFLPQSYTKICNVATEIIDPHSASAQGCHYFPTNNNSLQINKDVFTAFGYPRETYLSSITHTHANADFDLNFTVLDINTNAQVSLYTADYNYFAGNALKKSSFNNDPENNARLVIGKYSGDFLQILIQKINELTSTPVGPANFYSISTCDTVVFLRSFFLKLGCFLTLIERNNASDKVTQLYVYRPLSVRPEDIAAVLAAEKNRILANYDDFIGLLAVIRDQQGPQDFNNIFLTSSESTYKFSNDFYTHIIDDLTIIRNAINNTEFNNIRTLRTYAVNDFLKTNGPEGQYYFMNMATKYTKGILGILGINNVNRTGKRASQTFFEAGLKYPFVQAGGSKNKGMVFSGGVGFYCNFDTMENKSLDCAIHYCFNMSSEKITNVSYKKQDKNAERTSTDIDLHEQFYKDFSRLYGKFLTTTQYNIQTIQTYYSRLQINFVNLLEFYKFLAFDCFSDVINSIYSLDTQNIDYYSDDGIVYLINEYFENLVSDVTSDLQALVVINAPRVARALHAPNAPNTQIRKKKLKIIGKSKLSTLINSRNNRGKNDIIKAHRADTRIGKTINRHNRLNSTYRGGHRKMTSKNSTRKNSKSFVKRITQRNKKL
jgi:hypothetical protein